MVVDVAGIREAVILSCRPGGVLPECLGLCSQCVGISTRVHANALLRAVMSGGGPRTCNWMTIPGLPATRRPTAPKLEISGVIE